MHVRICIYLAGSCQSNVHARAASGPVLAAIASGEDVVFPPREVQRGGPLFIRWHAMCVARSLDPVVGGRTISVRRRRAALPRLSKAAA